MQKNKKNILLLAYQISPFKGSEYSVAWNYVKRMSKHHNITVIYGNSGEFLGDNKPLNDWLTNNKIDNVRFVFVKPSLITKFINWPAKKRVFSYLFYFAYNMWHRSAYNTAKNLIRKEKYDLIHYLGPIGYREQGFLWKLNIPYMRGPMGGFDFAPHKMLKDLPISVRVKQNFRTITSKLNLRYNYKIKKALRNTDLVLAATTESKNKLKLYFELDAEYMPENCIEGVPSLNLDKFYQPTKYHILMAGTLDGRKCNIILLQTLLKLKYRDRVHVDLIGDGPTRGMLEKFVIRNKLNDSVTFYGLISREEVFNLFNNAHLHVITSLSEGNPTVIWEAMSYGVPTMTLDHCGMRDIIDESCGIKVPIGSIEEISSYMAQKIDELLENPTMFRVLAEGTIKKGANYLWVDRINRYNTLYDRAITLFNKK